MAVIAYDLVTADWHELISAVNPEAQ